MDTAEDDDIFLDTVTVNSVKTENNDWIFPVTVNSTVIPVKPDTGAQVNIMSEKDYSHLKKKTKVYIQRQRH